MRMAVIIKEGIVITLYYGEPKSILEQINDANELIIETWFS